MKYEAKKKSDNMGNRILSQAKSLLIASAKYFYHHILRWDEAFTLVFLISFLLLCYTLLTFNPDTYPFSRNTVQLLILVSFAFSVYSHLVNKQKKEEKKLQYRNGDNYLRMYRESVHEAEIIAN